MIDLLYLSHTSVPAHLSELEGLDLLEPDEHVLVALDGVLLDDHARRLSGPTLHDYCLLTSKRVLLWARDYGRHLCYAFPLTELCLVEGVGLDPLHAHLHLSFAAPGEDEQRFTLTLLPIADLPAAVTLFRIASDTAQLLAAQGVEPQEASSEIIAVVSEHIFGNTNGQTQPDTPYRWSNSDKQEEPSSSSTSFQQDTSNLPPEQIYSVSRAGRAAWDTVNRAFREAELPFHLNGNDLRNMADALRALNDLLTTVAGNPGAREVVMAFLRRRGIDPDGVLHPNHTSPPETDEAPQEPAQDDTLSEEDTSTKGDYHEIPLRRRGDSSKSAKVVLQPASLTSDRGEQIPLRRRGSGERRS